MSLNRFNSLQTGKRIQSCWQRFCQDCLMTVSIPFKRESVSKVASDLSVISALMFQFPSNGKAYPKKGAITTLAVALVLFQFPSNGKAYPKRSSSFSLIWQLNTQVSIPFKRESVSKAFMIMLGSAILAGFNSLQTGKRIQSDKWAHTGEFRCGFQFPSNGKAYPK